MNNLTETITVRDGTTYEIKTRLSWFDTQNVDQAGEAMIFELDGETFKTLDAVQDTLGGGNFAGTLRCEMRVDQARKNLTRLRARLVGLSPRQIRGLPNLHVVQILTRIKGLEAEEQAEIAELLPGNPTALP